MTTYTVTFENEDGIDVVTYSTPMSAVHAIEKAVKNGDAVKWTGDLLADYAALIIADCEG